MKQEGTLDPANLSTMDSRIGETDTVPLAPLLCGLHRRDRILQNKVLHRLIERQADRAASAQRRPRFSVVGMTVTQQKLDNRCWARRSSRAAACRARTRSRIASCV